MENQIQTCTGMNCGKKQSQTNTIVFSLSARCDVSSKSKNLGEIVTVNCDYLLGTSFQLHSTEY